LLKLKLREYSHSHRKNSDPDICTAATSIAIMLSRLTWLWMHESVRNSWRRSPVVPFISAGQIVLCYLRRLHVDDDSHCLLGTTRFGPWSASVHFVQGRPSRSRGEA